jgi:hypothetical protein
MASASSRFACAFSFERADCDLGCGVLGLAQFAFATAFKETVGKSARKVGCGHTAPTSVGSLSWQFGSSPPMAYCVRCNGDLIPFTAIPRVLTMRGCST